MDAIWVIFALGSLFVTISMARDMEFKSTLDMVLTCLVTWAIMFVLIFGTFALVIGI